MREGGREGGREGVSEMREGGREHTRRKRGARGRLAPPTLPTVYIMNFIAVL